jgi:hypothetical protein
VKKLKKRLLAYIWSIGVAALDGKVIVEMARATTEFSNEERFM